MEAELLESVKLSNKKVIVKKNKEYLSRRNFIKYFSAGTAGVIFPISVPSQASDDRRDSFFQSFMGLLAIAVLLEARVSKLNMSKDFVYSSSPTMGSFYLSNDTDKESTGNLKLSLINEWDYNEFSSVGINYSIPPNTLHKYSFVNGPSATVFNDTQARLLATTKRNKQISQAFIIKA